MRLSEERKRRGWSRAELARRANLNAGTVGLIESGRFKPYPGQLAKLARALDMPNGDARTLLNEHRTRRRSRLDGPFRSDVALPRPCSEENGR